MRVGIVALFGLFVFAVGLTPSGARTASSSDLLLSPRIRLNETFVWQLRLRSSVSQAHPTAFVLGHTDVITCTALTQEDDAFVISRRVKLMFPPTPKDTASPPPGLSAALHDLGFSNFTNPAIEVKPSYILQRGVNLSTEWRPLNSNPICEFYSTAMFGAPPARITVGSSWHFSRPWYGCPSCTWITTVTSVEPDLRIVGLRVEMLGSQDDKNPMVTTLSIIDGGIIAFENDRVNARIGTSPSEEPWSPGESNDLVLLTASTPAEAARVRLHNQFILAANIAADDGDFSKAIPLYERTLVYASDHCDRTFIKYSIRAAQETAKEVSIGAITRTNGGDAFMRRRDGLWMQDACDRP